jgi:hypothetical protein
MLEVANDVFNDMEYIMSCHPQFVAWHRAIGSHGTVAVPCEWSTGLGLHCRCMFVCLAGIKCVTCPHILQAYAGSDVRHLGNMRACLVNTQA